MIIEPLLFVFISLAIFVYMFFRMIRNNDTTYVIILILEAIGIALNFVEVISMKQNVLIAMTKYILALIIPVGVIILEKKFISLCEIINTTKAKIYMTSGNKKKAKEALLDLVREKATKL